MPDTKDKEQKGFVKGSNPFGMESKISSATENYVQNKADKTVGETDNAGNKADSGTVSLEQMMHNTPGTYLYKWQNSNVAKDGGPYGHINNRDYKTTLRLAREADAYNNKPVEHMFSVGTRKTGGIKDLGIGYERPKIETMETRAMQQAFDLDSNQKRLAQALQDAVNHKDLNAFTKAYEQRFGIVLDKERAEMEMRKWTRQQEITQLLQKDITTFNAYFSRYLTADTCATLYNMLPTNPELAQFLSYTITNGAAPAMSDVLQRSLMEQFMSAKLGTNWRGKSPLEIQRAYSDSMIQLNSVQQMNNTAAGRATAWNMFHDWAPRDVGIGLAEYTRGQYLGG